MAGQTLSGRKDDSAFFREERSQKTDFQRRIIIANRFSDKKTIKTDFQIKKECKQIQKIGRMI